MRSSRQIFNPLGDCLSIWSIGAGMQAERRLQRNQQAFVIHLSRCCATIKRQNQMLAEFIPAKASLIHQRVYHAKSTALPGRIKQKLAIGLGRRNSLG